MSNRLNQKRVQDQIKEKRAKFYNGIYSGEMAIPENITEVFKQAVFSGVKPQDHQIHISSLRGIVGKPVSELSNVEIGSMVNVIMSTEWSKIYPNLETALDEYERLQNFIIHYNDLVTRFNIALDKEAETLMSLIQPQGNGMRIIASA